MFFSWTFLEFENNWLSFKDFGVKYDFFMQEVTVESRFLLTFNTDVKVCPTVNNDACNILDQVQLIRQFIKDIY